MSDLYDTDIVTQFRAETKKRAGAAAPVESHHDRGQADLRAIKDFDLRLDLSRIAARQPRCCWKEDTIRWRSRTCCASWPRRSMSCGLRCRRTLGDLQAPLGSSGGGSVLRILLPNSTCGRSRYGRRRGRRRRPGRNYSRYRVVPDACTAQHGFDGGTHDHRSARPRLARHAPQRTHAGRHGGWPALDRHGQARMAARRRHTRTGRRPGRLFDHPGARRPDQPADGIWRFRGSVIARTVRAATRIVPSWLSCSGSGGAGNAVEKSQIAAGEVWTCCGCSCRAGARSLRHTALGNKVGLHHPYHSYLQRRHCGRA
jgi:hypothetical protein